MHTTPALAIEWILVVFVAAVALIVLVKMFLGTIDLAGLLSEPVDPAIAGTAAGSGKASVSRLQLLLFSFVIVGLYVTLSFEAGEMVAIPNQVLGLLGISGGSYVVSKGIQANAAPVQASVTSTVIQSETKT
jgi:hypothetical protein